MIDRRKLFTGALLGASLFSAVAVAGQQQASESAPAVAKAEVKSAKYSEGYETGFVSGEAAHNNGETAKLDARRLDFMTPETTGEHNAAEKDGAEHYRAGKRQGYADGFAGLARGGVQQPPLPKLPFVENGKRATASRPLGVIKAEGSEKALSVALDGLIKAKPKCDLFMVSASWDLGGFADNVRLVYDAKNKLLFRLLRSTNQPAEDYFAWNVWFNIEPKSFAGGLPYMDKSIRGVSNRTDNKRVSPAQYSQHKEFGAFP